MASRLLMAEVNARLGLSRSTSVFEEPPRRPVEHPLQEYVGWFCSGEGIWARSTVAGGHLRLDFRGIEVIQENLRCVPAGGDSFVFRVGGSFRQIVFGRGPNGRVASLFVGHRVLRKRTPAELRRARTGGTVW